MAFRYDDFDYIVSIDFGTTFSGTCYAYIGKMTRKQLRVEKYPDITHVTHWKNNDGRPKIPTVSIYNCNLHLLSWGNVAKNFINDNLLTEENQAVEKFKLRLPSFITQKGAVHQTGSTSEDEFLSLRASIDYFRVMFDHTLSEMANHPVNAGTKEKIKIEKEKIRFVVTVPAQWNDTQRRNMRYIAKEAGLITEDDHENRLIIINESLSATLHCEREGQRNNTKLLEKNNIFMICDAGGGTVDIAIYESTENNDKNNNDSFRRCQLTADSGRECGSVFLDEKMSDLLFHICFGCKKDSLKKDEIRELETLIRPLTNDFLEIKLNFGDNFTKKFKKNIDREKLILDNKCCKSTILTIESKPLVDKSDKFTELKKLNESNKSKGLKQSYSKLDIKGVKVKIVGDMCRIKISYKCMRKHVFDKVIGDTLNLLRKQIEKINGGIMRTYLVGGFGCSEYLRNRIKLEFPEEKIGDLIGDEQGNTAAMRGALYYGIDGSRKEPQSDILVRKYKDTDTAQYTTLVCLDIGYNGTACSYRNLMSSNEEMIDIVNWPGLKQEKFMIPTAKKTCEGTTLWGAQVMEPNNSKPESLIIPSELMSSVKSDFKKYLSDYLRLVLEHVHNTIFIDEVDISGRINECRYVITMENCYPFFDNKSEMREIAQMAGVVTTDDSTKRLLLIRRDNAAAIYFEKTIFGERKTFSNHFLHINVYHDTCHLSLHESTKISEYNTETDNRAINTKETTTEFFRNVRCMKSSTFSYNFAAKLVANLDLFLSKPGCNKCTKKGSHDTYGFSYYSELRDGFLEYIKNELDFINYDKIHTITITKAKCCQISISVHNLLENVFLPAIYDLAHRISRSISQANMHRLFNFDRICFSALFVEMKKSNYSFLERIFLKKISQVMNIRPEFITPSKDNGKEALLGAAHYGNNPEDFTERVSRNTYFVNICGFKIKEFDENAKRTITKIKEKKGKNTKHEVYDEEAKNAVIRNKEPVNLYYQPLYNPFSKNNDFIKTPDDVTFLIHRGEKISENNQIQGISKKFYAQEECIAYATIYCSEDVELPDDTVKLNLKRFNKIHRFEIYIKRDEDDFITQPSDSRLYFDICIIPDNHEVKIEANVCSGLGSKIPEFRFRDEILVANIYSDEEQIIVDDLTIINKKRKENLALDIS